MRHDSFLCSALLAIRARESAGAIAVLALGGGGSCLWLWRWRRAAVAREGGYGCSYGYAHICISNMKYMS
eukprot:scaffold5941_cov125-Isochrysis_galbana.AAC.2